MRKSYRLLVLIFFLAIPYHPSALAVREILISEVTLEQKSFQDHQLSAKVQNTTNESREVTLRAQIFFFNRNSPPGDLPINILRKDHVMVLKPQEIRNLEVKFVEEGGHRLEPLRLEPQVRVRRQREWKY